MKLAMLIRTTAFLGLLGLCLCLAACGDDDGPTEMDRMDGGGSPTDDAGRNRPRPDAPDSGSSIGEPDAGDATTVSAAECRAQVMVDASLASDSCVACFCDECAAQAVDCDQNCFRTIRCILDHCAGDATDAMCIAQRCSQDLIGAGAAMSLGRCVNTCAATCTALQDEHDAGQDDGGS